MRCLDTVVVGGIATARATRAELAAQMAYDCRCARTGELTNPRVVTSSNGSVIVAFNHGGAMHDALLEADVIDADGMPLVMATRILCKRPLQERVATTDFIHNAAAVAAREGLRFYFLGGKPGVAEKAADNLRCVHEDLQIVGIRHGYFAEEEERAICDEVKSRGTDVLWVGLGSPRQEMFAVANRKRLHGVAWIRTCGGLFDHYDGNGKRAPLWMQNAGLEWLYRLAREPVRLGPRYLLTNPIAIFHLATKTHD